MAFSPDFIERLKDSNRIEDVMANYVQIQNAGSSKKCVCPFHTEKTASCNINVNDQYFYCFGCHAGGDVINFIRMIENLDYVEAVKFLAERSGISLPEDDFGGVDNTTRKKQRIYEMNREAAKYYFNTLRSDGGKIGLKYLIDRGLTPETIQHFGIGFALDRFSGLKDHMLSLGYFENELIDAGLLNVNKSGFTNDVFRNRIMFPFFDERGNIIAFGGRILNTEKDPRKYLNSKETLVYKKKKTLFGLNFAKKKIVDDTIILCEGNMDVIAMHQAGFENSVASCGTALTPEQVSKISYYAKNVIICYDSDFAGQNATKKAISLFSNAGIITKVINMTDAKDPDEYIKKFGSSKFKLLLDNSDDAVSFELNKAKSGLDINASDLDKIEYLKKSYDVIALIENDVEREVYISRIASETDIPKDAINGEILKRRKGLYKRKKNNEWNKIYKTMNTKNDKENPHSKQNKAEKGIIAYIFKNPDDASEIDSKLNADNFQISVYKRLFTSLLLKIKNDMDFSISSFNDEFSVEDMGRISEILNINREISIDKATVLDYIDLLNSHNNTSDNNLDEMSDDEFRSFAENLGKNK